MFAEGVVAQAARQAFEAGVVYVSAAGNQAAASYESAFRDSQQNFNVSFGGVVTTVRAHDFDPGGGVDTFQRVTVPANDATLSFQWNEQFGAAATNFEVFVIDALTGFVVSRGTQLNALNPVEIVSINNPTTVARPYDILIGVNGALPTGPINMKYVAFNSAFQINDFPTNSPTAFGHVLANGVLGVGAAEFYQTPEFGVNPPVLATFSSLGGVDVVAPQRGNTTFFGQDVVQDADSLPNFGGTSAAAPHVAALAALLLQSNPALTPAGVLDVLADSAIDMDSPFTAGFDTGFDAGTGHGLVDALGAIGQVTNTDGLTGLVAGGYVVINDTRDLLDANAGDGVIDIDLSMSGQQVSLRAAVIGANAGSGNATTLLMPQNQYVLSLTGNGFTGQGDLEIYASMKLIGTGAGQTIINAGGDTGILDRVFEVVGSGQTLTLNKLTVTGGRAPSNLTTGEMHGGAIFVRNGATLD